MPEDLLVRILEGISRIEGMLLLEAAQEKAEEAEDKKPEDSISAFRNVPVDMFDPIDFF